MIKHRYMCVVHPGLTEIAKRVSERFPSMRPRWARIMVNAVFEEMVGLILQGRTVAVPRFGLFEFGRFRARLNARREMTPAGVYVKFRPYHSFAKIVRSRLDESKVDRFARKARPGRFTNKTLRTPWAAPPPPSHDATPAP
jgi:nucleoid DNA-binding protein